VSVSRKRGRKRVWPWAVTLVAALFMIGGHGGVPGLVALALSIGCAVMTWRAARWNLRLDVAAIRKSLRRGRRPARRRATRRRPARA
jgi:hypothetical protein